jgi:hypothetical protein
MKIVHAMLLASAVGIGAVIPAIPAAAQQAAAPAPSPETIQAPAPEPSPEAMQAAKDLVAVVSPRTR